MRVLRPAQLAREELEEVAFDCGGARGLIPAFDRGVNCGGEQVRAHGGGGDRTVEVGDVARVVVPHGVVEPEFAKLSQRGVECTNWVLEVNACDGRCCLMGVATGAWRVALGEILREGVLAVVDDCV